MKGMTMKGIDILNKTMIIDMADWARNAALTCTAILVMSIIFFIIFVGLDRFASASICFWVILLSAFSILLICAINPQAETGRYRYEVTVDDSVSFVDLVEQYEVVEQNGRIWILEDKED